MTTIKSEFDDIQKARSQLAEALITKFGVRRYDNAKDNPTLKGLWTVNADGSANQLKRLRDWALLVTGTNIHTDGSLTFKNDGKGDAAGTTFNGSAARSISYNSIGAAASNHVHKNLIIKWGAGDTEGTNLFTYNGSTAKTINLSTPFSQLFTNFSNAGSQTTRITIGGVTKDLKIDADTIDGYHAAGLVKFYLSPMTSGAPADSAKSWFVNTMPSSSGAIVYNVPGSEKTIIAGKSSGAYGHMLQLNYDDNYLRILRYCLGSWQSTDWEKISAGYADSAGNADTLDGYHASAFATASHTHSDYVTALGTNGNYLTWTKNGSTSNITVPYAGKTDWLIPQGYFSTQEQVDAFFDTANRSLKVAYIGNDVFSEFSDGLVLAASVPGSYCHQIHMDDNANVIHHRSRNGDGSYWYAWSKLLDSSNYSSYAIPVSASCNKNWSWSGQSGQPAWIWGSNDGSNCYVWNPSNFSVNYASSAGNADTLDGNHASAFATAAQGVGTVISIDKSLTPTTSWADTGIKTDSTTFPGGNGSYVIQISVPSSSGTDGWGDLYTGYFALFTGTNSSTEDEILLHGASHSLVKRIYLKTVATANTDGKMHFYIASEKAFSAARTINFKFRKLI